uniref:Uncharacterized protein n=1 Tax=Timema monikensis TaxID=170555 RepID=A0A7R9E9I7_9NEOP|nr:unnamed protein product [Timema monikensis]
MEGEKLQCTKKQRKASLKKRFPNKTLSEELDVVTTLRDLVQWLMGIPAGLKLNYAFNNMLGRFFLYHINLWWTFLVLAKPLLELASEIFLCFGYLGLTFQVLYSLQLSGLLALFRLFLGKKYNPLRGRVDSCQYSPDQLFVGTLAFTILLFLLPTTFMYYIVFTTMKAGDNLGGGGGGTRASVAGNSQGSGVIPKGSKPGGRNKPYSERGGTQRVPAIVCEGDFRVNPFTATKDSAADSKLWTPTEDIHSELTEMGYAVRNVTRLGVHAAGQDQPEKPFPLILVTLIERQQLQRLSKGMRKNLAQQCHCRQGQDKCIKCGGAYTSAACKRPRSESTRCANCGGLHHENASICEVRKQLTAIGTPPPSRAVYHPVPSPPPPRTSTSLVNAWDIPRLPGGGASAATPGVQPAAWQTAPLR